MAEYQLFEPGTIPEYTTPEWYAERESAPHIDQEMHRPRLELAAQYANSITGGFGSLVDLGCGDGGFLTLVKDAYEEVWGYDLQQSNVDAAAARGVDVRFGDCVNDEIDWGYVAVATEMLEHLVDPHAYVRKIAQHSNWLIASSPWTETAEAHYGFHTWAWDQDGYRALIEQAGYRVVEHGTTGMFQVLLASAR